MQPIINSGHYSTVVNTLNASSLFNKSSANNYMERYTVLLPINSVGAVAFGSIVNSTTYAKNGVNINVVGGNTTFVNMANMGKSAVVNVNKIGLRNASYSIAIENTGVKISYTVYTAK